MSSASTPSVSVVIPTYNRAGGLPRLAAALAAQTAVADLEVVFVDDASTDDTDKVLARIADEAPFPVKILRQPTNCGPARGRNRAWREARAPLICFTDDDCTPAAGWVRALTDALATADLVQGRTLPDPAQAANLGPFSHTLDVKAETGYYETANMGYRREVLQRVGGFDEKFRYAYGEDCELAWRAKETGATSAFAEDAVVFHEVTPSRWRRALRGTKRREGLVQLFRRHPDLRARLGKGVFYEPTHLPALVALGLGVAAVSAPRSAPRWAAACAAGLWYASNCRRVRWHPRSNIHWLGIVPASFVVDLADVCVFARASVRYRTLQL